MHVPVS